MTQIKNIVWKEIQSSPSIRLDLSRNLINVRALAKHIQKKPTINASLDAIISAIRRYEEEKPYTKLRETAFKVIIGSTLSSKNHIASITLQRNEEVVKTIPKIFNQIKIVEHGTLQIVHTQKAMKIYLDESNLDNVVTLFSKNHVLAIEKNMGEVTVDLNKKSWNTPGVLNILTSELALNNTNILETLTCVPEIVFIFREEDLMKAYEVLYQLSKGKR